MSDAQTYTVAGQERVPLDSVAARVVSPGPKWVALDREMPDWHYGKDAPKTYPAPRGQEDLTGTVRGRMRIVGYLYRTQASHLWLARCACGRYERRKARPWRKALRDGRNDDRCEYCKMIQNLRSTDEWRRHGRNFDDPAPPCPAPAVTLHRDTPK